MKRPFRASFAVMFFVSTLAVYAGQKQPTAKTQWGDRAVNAVQHEELKVDDYKNLELVTESLPANRFGLTREAVQTRAELRLRSVGIKPCGEGNSLLAKLLPGEPGLDGCSDSILGAIISDPSTRGYLHVSVNILGTSSGITVQFIRPVLFRIPTKEDVRDEAIVYDKSILGVNTTQQSVLDTVGQMVDDFLNLFLRANQ